MAKKRAEEKKDGCPSETEDDDAKNTGVHCPHWENGGICCHCGLEQDPNCDGRQ